MDPPGPHLAQQMSARSRGKWGDGVSGTQRMLAPREDEEERLPGSSECWGWHGMGWRHGRTMGTRAGGERDEPWVERAGRKRQNCQEMAQGVFMPW